MKYNTALSLKHFRDPGFSLLMRHIHIHFAISHPEWPTGNELNRAWELTAAARAIRDFGYMQSGKTALVVGGGMDLLAYVLTDYLDGVWRTTSPEDPPVSGIRWRPRRLHALPVGSPVPHERFDVVLVAGELSEFGSLAEVSERVSALSRSLKSGGLLVVLTEILDTESVDRGFPNKRFFTKQELTDYVITASRLSPVDHPDFAVDELTRRTAYPFEEAVKSGIRQTNLMLTSGDMAWTSACIVLRKMSLT